MAGRPRTKNREPRPRQRLTRVANRRRRLDLLWGKAQTPLERLQVAYDALTGVAAGHQPHQETTDLAVEEAAEAVRTAALRILSDHEKTAARKT